jgi:hypothetical protein
MSALGPKADITRRQLAYIYSEEEPVRRWAAKIGGEATNAHEAPRIAVNIAKLPDLLAKLKAYAKHRQ